MDYKGNRCMGLFTTQGGLYQGLKITKSLNILNLKVIGDSLLIIKHMIKGTNPLDVRLRHLSSSFPHLNFYHVLRSNNIEAEPLVSLATSQKIGTLVLNKEVAL
jgi:hypothetical protein